MYADNHWALHNMKEHTNGGRQFRSRGGNGNILVQR